jgi:hypothetical protein
VVLVNLGSESEMCVGSRVRLVGVSISFEKNFYQLPFTPPSLVRRISSSDGSFRHCRPPFIPASTAVGSSTSSPPSLGYQKFVVVNREEE